MLQTGLVGFDAMVAVARLFSAEAWVRRAADTVCVCVSEGLRTAYARLGKRFAAVPCWGKLKSARSISH